jgi:hypothetical protein
VTVSFYCPCGFHGTTLDDIEAHTEPLDGSCCNCGGVKCMGCVLRDWGHDCEDDCPECCAVNR